MRETELEVEEREVERVYCDECGDECTDDHRIEPSEVCVSCSSETAVDRVVDLLDSDENGNDELGIGGLLFFPLVFPLVLLIAALAAAEPDSGISRRGAKIMTLFTIGTALWTTILLLALIAIV